MTRITLSIASACLMLGSAGLTQAQSLVGLGSGGASLSFYSSPSSVPTNVTVTNLSAGETLIGIDYFSSSNGQLYGLGSQGRLYTIAANGVANLDVSSPVSGAQAIDFNPVANRLRIFQGTNNFRLTPGTGVVSSDGTLAYASADPNFGVGPNLFAAAYTNNFAGSAATSLYSIDTSLDILVLHSGTPQFNTLNTVGPLSLGGVTFNAVAGTTGFDVRSAGGDTAYFSSGNALFTIALNTGVLTSVGTLSGNPIVDIAFGPVPEPSTYALMAFGALGLFVWLRRARTVLS